MRNYVGVKDLDSKDYELVLRYANTMLKKHANLLLREQIKGKIIPTQQIARPLKRDKNIVLFKFVA